MGTFIAKKSLKIRFVVIEIFMKIHFITRKTNFHFSKPFSIFDFGQKLGHNFCPKLIFKIGFGKRKFEKIVPLRFVYCVLSVGIVFYPLGLCSIRCDCVLSVGIVFYPLGEIPISFSL